MGEQTDIKVTVIVPVYNAEKTIAECLHQLMKQTLRELEILVVDDCSTDETASIVRALAAQSEGRIRMLRTGENSGAGGARNLGMDEARGAYIGFVDGDDLVVPEMYEKLYAVAQEQQSDFVDSGYYNEENDTAMLHTADAQTGTLDDEKRSALIVSGGYIVSKLFRRAFLTEQKMRFRKHAILEDSEFLTRIFATARSCANIKEVFYQYRYYPDSASREQEPGRYVTQLCNAMEANYLSVYKLPNYEGIREAVEYAVIQMYDYGVIMSLKAFQDAHGTNRREVIDMLKRLRQLRKKTARSGYQNRYVQEKINPTDISIMERNDQSPDAALALLSSAK